MSDIQPILRQMIDNNKPHWKPDTIRGAHKLLDEYEAKARAWGEMEMLQGEFDCGSEYRDFYSDVVKVIHKWQRGEYR